MRVDNETLAIFKARAEMSRGNNITKKTVKYFA